MNNSDQVNVTRPSDSKNNRCQIDLIDYQLTPDGLFKFVLIYQECLTKFIILKPLLSNKVEEVAQKLHEIFCIFGAPSIIHSSNSQDVVIEIIKKVESMSPSLKIVYGKSTQNNFFLNKSIETMITECLKKNPKVKSNEWSKVLDYVQLQYNSTCVAGKNKSPYEAMFNCQCKVGVKYLIEKLLEKVNTEEELVQLFSKLDIGDASQSKTQYSFSFGMPQSLIGDKSEIKPKAFTNENLEKPTSSQTFKLSNDKPKPAEEKPNNTSQLSMPQFSNAGKSEIKPKAVTNESLKKTTSQTVELSNDKPKPVAEKPNISLLSMPQFSNAGKSEIKPKAVTNENLENPTSSQTFKLSNDKPKPVEENPNNASQLSMPQSSNVDKSEIKPKAVTNENLEKQISSQIFKFSNDTPKPVEENLNNTSQLSIQSSKILTPTVSTTYQAPIVNISTSTCQILAPIREITTTIPRIPETRSFFSSLQIENSMFPSSTLRLPTGYNCNCKVTQCGDGRCGCRKRNVNCSPGCHPNLRSCFN